MKEIVIFARCTVTAHGVEQVLRKLDETAYISCFQDISAWQQHDNSRKTPGFMLVVDDMPQQQMVLLQRLHRQLGTEVVWVFLAFNVDSAARQTMCRLGMSGVLGREMPLPALSSALALLLSGQDLYTFGGGEKMWRLQQVYRLSSRELEVLHQLVLGKTNEDIAAKLGIKLATVKVHMRVLKRKIGCSNRTQLALWGQREGLVSALAAVEQMEALADGAWASG